MIETRVGTVKNDGNDPADPATITREYGHAAYPILGEFDSCDEAVEGRS